MEKTLKVIAIISLLAIVVAFIYELLMFAKTGDVVYGILAILISLMVRVSGNVNITKDERK